MSEKVLVVEHLNTFICFRSESGSNSVELSENPVYDEYIKKIPSLENKVVAITGTTSGMGFCLAQST